MTAATPEPTFRDPAGSLAFEEDRVVRRIRPEARLGVLDFLESALCVRLQERGDLVGATVDDSTAGLRLIHPKIPVPAYPWEWSPSQWLAAAELTLTLCEEALHDGWILKDATPLNILFAGPRPVLVDILSFERRDPQSMIWLAYGQYVRTFLLPLVANKRMGWPLEMSLFRRDGLEPAELFASMGWAGRISRDALWPVTLAALLERPGNSESKDAKGKSKQVARRVSDPQMALDGLQRLLAGLRKRTRRALPRSSSSKWSKYQGTLTHYTEQESAKKHEWVRNALAETQPKRVLDIGANTGEFSALSAEMGAQVVALERDAASAERLFRMSRERNLSIQTIHADIARPTPAAGWENSESTALLARLEGQFELVLMLAVIHHLLLMEQIPLPAILALCHRLTLRHLAIEWVPVEDPMFQSLMRGRDELYGGLREDDLIAACAGRFRILRRQPLDNGRVLFLLQREG
jgi:SAM-dependent methyltransferase